MSKIDELKTSLRTTRKPDDVIMAILASTSKTKIVKDPTVFHNAIFELSKNESWNGYLEDFFFDVSGISPFSDLLDQVLSRLETSCVLATPNPRYEEYDLQKDYLSISLNKFDASQQDCLKQMANKFEEILISQ